MTDSPKFWFTLLLVWMLIAAVVMPYAVLTYLYGAFRIMLGLVLFVFGLPTNW